LFKPSQKPADRFASAGFWLKTAALSPLNRWRRQGERSWKKTPTKDPNWTLYAASAGMPSRCISTESPCGATPNRPGSQRPNARSAAAEIAPSADKQAPHLYIVRTRANFAGKPKQTIHPKQEV
jgi:hypothetical protein